jgi:hypothetical protein
MRPRVRLERRGAERRIKLGQAAHGAYLLGTNHKASDAVQFWRWYIQLTQGGGWSPQRNLLLEMNGAPVSSDSIRLLIRQPISPVSFR